jgi:nitrogen fixation protein FixH
VVGFQFSVFSGKAWLGDGGWYVAVIAFAGIMTRYRTFARSTENRKPTINDEVHQ